MNSSSASAAASSATPQSRSVERERAVTPAAGRARGFEHAKQLSTPPRLLRQVVALDAASSANRAKCEQAVVRRLFAK